MNLYHMDRLDFHRNVFDTGLGKRWAPFGLGRHQVHNFLMGVRALVQGRPRHYLCIDFGRRGRPRNHVTALLPKGAIAIQCDTGKQTCSPRHAHPIGFRVRHGSKISLVTLKACISAVRDKAIQKKN